MLVAEAKEHLRNLAHPHEPTVAMETRLDGHWFEFFRGALAETVKRNHEVETILNLTLVSETHAGVNELLRRIPGEPATPREPTRDEIARIFGNASAGLLGWPQEIDGCWIERTELAELKAVLQTEKSTFIALLGEAGCGKSALLARLGTHLRATGQVLLAIKADLLPKDIATIEKLDNLVGTSEPLVTCIRRLAREIPVVLLIDQVDALTELMDQHTARLTALLSLINRLRGVENVHIVLSCREFEFNHDVRVSSLQPTPIRIGDPPWALAERILYGKGLTTTNWSESIRKLLQRPQHLSVFVQHFGNESTPPLFESYHAMLQSVLDRILGKSWGGSAISVAERVAADMADSEELWLPKARYDKDRVAIDQLVAADILTYGLNKPTVGFRHQTLFDFVRSRAFASGAISFSEHLLSRQDALFVRPTVWSTLHYMRHADLKGYTREFRALWDHKHLRVHIRLLLVEFLGRVENPDAQECKWFLSVLADPTLRGKAFRAAEHNQAWYLKLRQYLPELMQRDEVSAWHCSWIFSRAMGFAKDDALDFIQKNWLPSSNWDGVVLQTLLEFTQWDERSVSIVETIAQRNPVPGWAHRALVKSISEHRPDLAPRLVAKELLGLLPATNENLPDRPKPAADASQSDWVEYYLGSEDDACRHAGRIVNDPSRWYGLVKIAVAAPREYVLQVLPWVARVAQRCANEKEGRANIYQHDSVFELLDDHAVVQSEFPAALVRSIEGFAETYPENFAALRVEWQGSELLIVHRLLSRGSARLPECHSRKTLEYLLGDPRRFAIGSCLDQHHETCGMIRAIVPSLDETSRLRLEKSILGYNHRPIEAEIDRDLKRNLLRGNRQKRLRLLRAFSSDYLSANGARILLEEERALPNTPNRDAGPIEGGLIESRMSAEQMRKATNEELLGFIEELPDATGDHHPRDWSKGGSIQAARSFGEVAETDRARAVELIAELRPGEHERYVGEAIRAIARTSTIEAGSELISLIHDLAVRGFCSDDFRVNAAWSLRDVTEKTGGLGDSSCDLLESWLSDVPQQAVRPDEDQESPENSLKSEVPVRSILLDQFGPSPPQGNFPILEALYFGFHGRNPSEPGKWLDVLERHLGRRENPEVWRALLRSLYHVAPDHRARASSLIEQILVDQHEVIDSVEGARLIGLTGSWLPEAVVEFCLKQWQHSQWELGPQAAAEVASTMYVLNYEHDCCRRLVSQVLACETENLTAMRLGLAYIAAGYWRHSVATRAATRILLELLPHAEGDIAQAWLSLFRRLERMPQGEFTIQLIDGIIAHPEIMNCGHTGYLVERLQELLGDDYEPTRIAAVVVKLLALPGEKVGRFKNGVVASSGDLVDMALTLQRIQETRVIGLEIFEELMERNAYEIPEVLKDLDRRID
jgi:hypothetical protein